MRKKGNMRPSVTVQDFLDIGRDPLRMDLVYGASGVKRKIIEAALNRPQLALAGFYSYFARHRLQVVGLAEYAFLSHLEETLRRERLEALFQTSIPCVIFSRYKRIFPEVESLAESFGVPVLRTRMVTRHFINAATLVMENLMAPRLHVQGTMLEVSGLGVLIEGKPGLGKSETALGLIKRGHALVSDDVTDVRRDSSGGLIGAPIGVVKHHMEIRGIGIIYVPALFGVTSVRGAKQLDLVITLCPQDDFEIFDRSGETENFRDLLGVKVPQIIIPVAPGRDLVNVVETAAMECKLRLSGHFSVRDLDARLKSRLRAEGSA